MAKKETKTKKKEAKPEEKKYVVSFVSLYKHPRPKRAFRAINLLKRFVFKHLRVKGENVAISQQLNQAIWAKGREHIPRKLEIKIVKAEEKANVYLATEKIEKPKKEEKKPVEKKEEKKEETTEEKQEQEKKKKEKKAKEKAAEVTDIKRGTGKGK